MDEPRTDREKLRLRYAEATDDELRAILESQRTTALEDEIARETLAVRGGEAPPRIERAPGRAHALDAPAPVRPRGQLGGRIGAVTVILVILLLLRVLLRFLAQ